VNYCKLIGFEVITAVVMKMKIAIFWDIAPCRLNMSRCFGGMYHLHLQGQKSAEQEKGRAGGWAE
jgi:hypothetical protein